MCGLSSLCFYAILRSMVECHPLVGDKQDVRRPLSSLHPDSLLGDQGLSYLTQNILGHKEAT